jgi:hypothetical protein
MPKQAIRDQQQMGNAEADENRKQDANRLLHPAHVEHQQYRDQQQLGGELEMTDRRREQAEQRIDPARDRY